MQHRKTKRAADNRERIFAAAIELIGERGFRHVTMGQIAEAAGVARASVFNHFPSKTDLLNEYFLRFTSEIVASAKRSKATGFHDRMNALFDAAGAKAREKKATLREIAVLTVAGGPLAAADEQADATLLGFIRTEVEKARLGGDVKQEYAPAFIASLILALMTASLHEWVNAEGRSSLATLLKTRFDALMSGLARRRRA